MSKPRQIDIAAGSQLIRIQPTEYRGKQYVDVRKHFEKDGEWLPTGKGISIPVDDVHLVIDALKKMKGEHAVAAKEAGTFYAVLHVDDFSIGSKLNLGESDLYEDLEEVKEHYKASTPWRIVKVEMVSLRGTEVVCKVKAVLAKGSSSGWVKAK